LYVVKQFGIVTYPAGISLEGKPRSPEIFENSELVSFP